MIEAKLKFNHGNFEIITEGQYVLCAVSKKKILIQDLKYWNVNLQEAYFSPIEVAQKFKND